MKPQPGAWLSAVLSFFPLLAQGCSQERHFKRGMPQAPMPVAYRDKPDEPAAKFALTSVAIIDDTVMRTNQTFAVDGTTIGCDITSIPGAQ